MARIKLKQLLPKGTRLRGSSSVEITGLTSDSRKLSPGNLFFAKKGGTFDGVSFIPQAIQAGAAAIVTDLYDPFCPVPQVIVPDVSAFEASLAALFYGHPSTKLFTAGITGSKGKTTTTYLVQHLLQGLGLPCGLVSTVETAIVDRRFPSTHTTHDVISNHKLLKEMVDHGCLAAALEVSSHGLAQGRVDAIDFSLAIFTNLYSDHLDYHKTIEHYAASKRLLIERAKEKVLLNKDNAWTPFMLEKASAPVLTYGIEKKADLVAQDISFSSQGTSFTVSFQNQTQSFHTRLMGRFNVYNLLAAIGVGLHRGAPLSQIAAILALFQSVPGRLQEVFSQKSFRVFVDYAHTGPALENVLCTIREMAPKRLIVVFGCGGGRDPSRRKDMGQAADLLADFSIITTDNPRHEDPQEIARQIIGELKRPFRIELDRKRAIAYAIEQAQEGDIVLIAGKGHEKVQILGHQTVPFDDVAVAQEILNS